MTQAKVKFASFETYLAWSDDPENYLEGRFELIDGKLVEVPPESGLNNWIARYLMFAIANSSQVPFDPEAQTVTMLRLQDGSYGEFGWFQGEENIVSPTFPDLQLTAAQLFQMGQ